MILVVGKSRDLPEYLGKAGTLAGHKILNAEDIDTALTTITAHQPGVIILIDSDCNTSHETCVDPILQISPYAKIMILRDFQDPRQLIQYLISGVLGCLPSRATPRELCEAITVVLSGRLYISPVVVPNGMGKVSSN